MSFDPRKWSSISTRIPTKMNEEEEKKMNSSKKYEIGLV